MGKYSANGSPEFDALVDAHMERIAEEVYSSIYSKHWNALILHGTYGRGEGAPLVEPNGAEVPFNDYEMLVVTKTIDPLIRRSLKRMEASLSEEFGNSVILRPFLDKDLPGCGCSLLNYEVKQGHRVIWGNPDALAKMKACAPDQIPLEEGTRLLLNRGKLLLEIKMRLETGKPLSSEEHCRFIRYVFQTNLALGDCALLLRGAYDASREVKKERIGQVDLHGLHDARDMVEAYHRAVDFKKQPNFRPLETVNLHVWFDETAQRFENVFLWYERRRLNRKFRNPQKYAHAFPNLGNEGRSFQNAVRNLRAFGMGAFPDVFTHPRLRLYAALPLLLAAHADRGEIRWILRTNQSTIEGLYEVFESLHQRFA